MLQSTKKINLNDMESLKEKLKKYLNELALINSVPDKEVDEISISIDQFTDSGIVESVVKADAFEKLLDKLSNCILSVDQKNDEELMIRIANLAQYLDEFWNLLDFDRSILFAFINFLAKYDEAEHDRLQVPVLKCMYDFTENKTALVNLLFYLTHVSDEPYKGYIKLQAKILLKNRYIFADEELLDLHYMAENLV